MKTQILLLTSLISLIIAACQPKTILIDDVWSLAQSRKSDLCLGVYVTAHTVEQMFSTNAGQRESVSLLKCNGISKVYLEVYRSGKVVSPEILKNSISVLKRNGFEVIGGIATLPGGDYGVPQQGPLTWLNWQNPKTQNDIRKIMEDAAPFFDTFIVDDFFCTADTSAESKIAKGDRSWSEYRRLLLTDLAQSVIIKPAKAKNPNLKIIIKYPQWYDRFHLFGYDLVSEPELFDGVWVGTETRGQYTQRYGFVQPYEGFINYRWISTFAGEKIGGAWFDHGDCTDQDYIEQAYQSVLAGAKELVIFNFDSFVTGHPGHHLLRQDFEKLADLAKAVAVNPIQGPVGYKPPQSNAGGDLYLMDYIGMFGISLVPESKYPEHAKVIFLPTQAATDSDVVNKVIKSLDSGAKIIMTTGFITSAKNGEKLAQLAQINWPLAKVKSESNSVLVDRKTELLKFPLNMDFQIEADGASVLLEADGKRAFMTQDQNQSVTVLNTHTFSQADFDAVGEVLLCPRQIGLIELPESWVNTIRSAFHMKDEPELNAPSRVTFQQLTDQSIVIQNYNQEKTSIIIQLNKSGNYIDGFSGNPIVSDGNKIEIEMAPRSHIWFRNTIN